MALYCTISLSWLGLQFYIGGFVLHNFIELVRSAVYIGGFVLHNFIELVRSAVLHRWLCIAHISLSWLGPCSFT